jgi:choline dehydrogenase-like flavoprotein
LNKTVLTLQSIDWQRNDSRSSSVEAYYTPVEKERSNIAVLINHRAVQIVTEGTNDTVKGTAVKLVDSNGGSFTANVGKEVIVSAGAINTPQILQLSGIGDKKHLDSIGINTVIDLPGVGKNLQEQTMSIVGWKANTQETIKSLSNVIAYPDIKAMFGGRVANISDTIKNNIYQYSLDAVASGAIVSKSAAEFLLGNQADLMINKGVGLLELFFDNGGYNINAWNLLPFSRGSINIKSNDYNETMRIDTRTFAAKIDRTIQIEGARMARQIWKSAPLRSLVSEETQPADKVADDENGGSDDDWWNWISENWLSVNHPIGTCSMMLEEHGGVVDGNLRVYHSSNIRIVDASVLPHQLSAHLSATLYGVAENAADIIKAGN